MRDTRAIGSFKDIYWDIRPRPDFGTIEFRICDLPLTLTETLRLAAFVRALTISGLRLLEERPALKKGNIKRHWIAVENKWLATRYGLNATYIRTPSGKRRVLSHDLSEMIERLMPVAKEFGDDKYLAALQPAEKIDTGSDQQRRFFRENGNWKGLTDFMSQQLSSDLETYSPPKPVPAIARN